MTVRVAFRNSFVRHTPKLISYVAVSTVAITHTISYVAVSTVAITHTISYVAVSTVAITHTIHLLLSDERKDDFGFGKCVKF